MSSLLVIISTFTDYGEKYNRPVDPNPLTVINGICLIEKTVATVKQLERANRSVNITVITSKKDLIPISQKLADPNIRFVINTKGLGTGQYMNLTKGCIGGRDVLVIPYNMPFLTPQTLEKVIESSHLISILGMTDEFTRHYEQCSKRIVFDSDGKISRIEPTDEETHEDKRSVHKICYSDIIFIKNRQLGLTNRIRDRDGKYHLFDIVELGYLNGIEIGFVESSYAECLRVNNKSDLRVAEFISNKDKLSLKSI